jgi:hypothetical protein
MPASARLLRTASLHVVGYSKSCVLADPIRLLDFSRQLIAISRDGIEVIISQFAPLCFHLAFVLQPVSFNDIPVHNSLQEKVAQSAKVTIALLYFGFKNSPQQECRHLHGNPVVRTSYPALIVQLYVGDNGESVRWRTYS